MSEEQIILKLEMYIVSLYQNNCGEHACPECHKYYFSKVVYVTQEVWKLS